MSVIGTVDSLWRYPVKSMRGEEMDELFVGYAGVYGDRLFAFHSSTGPAGFPFLTGREQRQMIRYRPRFRNSEKAARPINVAEAARLSPNINPISANATDLMIDVESPDGQVFAIDDPALVDRLGDGINPPPLLTLLRSDKAMTDCKPVSIISVQTTEQLSNETQISVDKRRFRANIYLDLSGGSGFAENEFVGRSIKIGPKVIVSVLQRDGRCMMIALNPDTAQTEPAILKKVAQAHDGTAGVYGAVVVEGTIRRGDPIELLG